MSTAQHILIVDDDTLLLDMYSIKFRERGFTVDVAKGSEEAVRKVEEGGVYDVVLLDIVMPGMDGFQLLEALAPKRAAGKPLLIVLSNQGQESDVKRATELGADGYIIKANTVPSEVVGRVEAYVAGGAQMSA